MRGSVIKHRVVDEPLRYWDTNCSTKESIADFETRLGDKDHPQRVAFRRFLLSSGYKSMLDCGAGLGLEWVGLVSDGIDIEYVALDVTEAFLSHMTDMGISVMRGNVEKIPAPDNSYDVVYERAVLEHTADWKQALREMSRVARRCVYLAMYKPFGNKTIRRKELGVWVNTYAQSEFYNICDELRLNVIRYEAIDSYALFHQGPQP